MSGNVCNGAFVICGAPRPVEVMGLGGQVIGNMCRVCGGSWPTAERAQLVPAPVEPLRINDVAKNDRRREHLHDWETLTSNGGKPIAVRRRSCGAKKGPG